MKYLLLTFLIPLSTFADTFIFEWDAVTLGEDLKPVVELKGYKVYVSKIPNTYTSPAALVSAPTTRLTYEQTFPGTYYATVTAYNEGGESKKSNEISFVVKGVKPVAPGNLKRTRR